jgi:hypothetical protein
MITLSSRERNQYILSVAVIDTIDELAKTPNFTQLPVEAKRALKSASTNLKKWRDIAPVGIDHRSKVQLMNDIGKYSLALNYQSTDRVQIKASDLDELLQYAVMGMCNGCTLTGKAVDRCPFRRNYGDRLAESDCQTGECQYSFSFNKNEVWHETTFTQN